MENILSNGIHMDYTPNNQKIIPEMVSDFGQLLRDLRDNHGYSIQKFSRIIGISPTKISRIECSRAELPPENDLRRWLNKLGCGKNTNKLILLARQWRINHYLRLHRNEACNPDIIRLLDAYREQKLTDHDRALLTLIARN